MAEGIDGPGVEVPVNAVTVLASELSRVGGALEHSEWFSRADSLRPDVSVLARQIATVDRQLDQLVYELYALTDAEIAIVEEATTR